MNTKVPILLIVLVLLGVVLATPAPTTLALSEHLASTLVEESQITPVRFRPGDILVVDRDAGTDGMGALFRVNQFGIRTIIQDFGDGDPTGLDPIDVVVASTGEAYVLDSGAMVIFRINLSTLQREVYSKLTEGDQLDSPQDMAIDAEDNLWVIEQHALGESSSGLFYISEMNSHKRVFNILNGLPRGIDIHPTGQIFITNKGINTTDPGNLLIIDPINLVEIQQISFARDFKRGDCNVFNIGHLAINASNNQLFFIDTATLVTRLMLLPNLNARRCIEVTTIGGTPEQPPENPWVVIDPMRIGDKTRNILVTQPDAGTAGKGRLILLVVDDQGRVTSSTELSDFGDSNQGPKGEDPMGMAFVRMPISPAPPEGTLVGDRFNRANGPIGNRWVGSTGDYRIVNKQLHVGAGGSIVFDFEHGPAAEVSFTFAKVDLNSQHQGLILKALGSSQQNAALIAADYDAKNRLVYIRVVRPDIAGVKTYPTPISVVYEDGDQMKMRVLSNGAVEVYNGDVLAGMIQLDIDDMIFFNFRGGRAGMGFIDASDTIIDNFVVEALPVNP